MELIKEGREDVGGWEVIGENKDVYYRQTDGTVFVEVVVIGFYCDMKHCEHEIRADFQGLNSLAFAVF